MFFHAFVANFGLDTTEIHFDVTTAVIGQKAQPIVAGESSQHMATLGSLLLNCSRKVYFDLLWGKAEDFRSLNVSILHISCLAPYSAQKSLRKWQLILLFVLYLKKLRRCKVVTVIALFAPVFV